MSQRKQCCRYHRLIKTNIYTDGRYMNVNISYSAGSIRDKTRAHTSKYYRQTTGHCVCKATYQRYSHSNCTSVANLQPINTLFQQINSREILL